MKVGDLTYRTRSWVSVTVQSVAARGRLNPRLVLGLELTTPTDRVDAELRDVRLQVVFDGEVLGEGRLIGERAARYGASCTVDVPVDRRTLDFVTSRLGRGASVGLRLLWYGLLRVRWEPNESDGRRAGDPEPGVWTDAHLPVGQHDHPLTIARSDWYAQVLQPIGGEDYVHLEVAVPRGEEAAAWRQALAHLDDAEKAYALGDDPAVFQYLRALFEALPGAPKNVFDVLPEPKRQELDQLVHSFVDYLHHGRHVSKVGASAGAFPVDHQDAAFVLAMAQVVLSHTSQALAAARLQAG
jgi:hypothetical protein